MQDHGSAVVRACPCCGLLQRIPEPAAGTTALCARCRCALRRARPGRSAARVAAFSLASLALYPPAMSLPVLEMERFGHAHSATIWSGAVDLMTGGQVAVGLLVLVCSVVVPLLKIAGMLVLTAGPRLLRPHHRMLTFRTIDLIGRWGMIDVLLVAILVALVKLGDWAEVHPGPGVLAFAGVVVCSLAASASFDPVQIWEDEA